MMFKKWHITGLNKNKHTVAAILAAVLLLSIPVSAAKPEDFTDLEANKSQWYYEEVARAIDLGLFGGQSESYFGVDEQITRAEFVTALSRLCGADTEGYTTDHFIDVKAEDWFLHPVSWAFEKGLVGGTSENEFSPNRPVNRQEMSKMLANAIEIIFQKELTTEGAFAFNDQEQIDWGLEYVQKCNVAGIFNGDENGNFNPKQYAPRHQAACVFYRCHRMLQDYTLTVSGFELDFDVDTDYYLAQPADFENCRIVEYTGFTSLTVSVEQYASYYPYKSTAYKLGDALKLGHGRAKITLDVTLNNGEERQYLIALTDPDAADYAYARAKVTTKVNLRAEPSADSAVLATLLSNARVYYLKTEGDWCMVEQLSTGRVGYVHKDYIQWNWKTADMPARYKAAIEALQADHPNWTFTFVDVEMSYADALAKYGAANETYIDPLNYLVEDKIFAMLNIDVYDQETWSDDGIRAIWANEKAITKDQAVEYFNAASKSILMNPQYIACRAALESGYGTSKFATGTVTGYEGYYNFFGIQCYDSNPTVGAEYAKNRNWNSVFRSIVEGGNWVKDQYLDQGAITPYFFRFRGFQDKVYMTDVQAPLKEASILKKAYTDPNAKAHFVIPVYSDMPTE